MYGTSIYSMKVCINIQAAIGQQAGVGRYTQCLVEELARDHGQHDLRLFYFDFQRKGSPFTMDTVEEQAIRWCPGRVVQKAWKTIGFPPFDWFAGKADLYHFPNFIRPPISQGKSVVTIHDVSFLRHPETTEEKNLRYLTAQIKNTVKLTDAIITDSHFSKKEIEDLLDVDPKRVFAVHLGLEQSKGYPSNVAIANVAEHYGLERPYILAVGTLEPRKNYPFLMDVFERMDVFDGDLVIAGMRGWKYEPIYERARESCRSDRIKLLDYVPEEHLSGLYAGAELLAVPSLYEGFGFTPLEAMACGTPVVSSAGGSLPEVLGEAAVIVEGFDKEKWLQEMQKVMEDTPLRSDLRSKGDEQVQKYRWADTAANTLQVYEKVSKE